MTKVSNLQKSPLLSKSEVHPSPYSQYLFTYFKLGFYTLINPFFVVFNPTTKTYSLSEPHNIQQAFCMFAVGSILIQYCCGLFTLFKFTGSVKDSVVEYFNWADYTTTIQFHLVLFFISWSRKKQIIEMFQYWPHDHFYLTSQVKWIAGGIAFTTTTMAIYQATFVPIQSMISNSTEFFDDQSKLLGGHFIIFHPADGQISAADVVITIWYLMCQLYFWILILNSSLLILLAAMTVHHVVMNFATFLKTEDDVANVLREYAFLKKLIEKINDALGPLTLCFVLEAIPFFAFRAPKILNDENWIQRIIVIFALFQFIMPLEIAARGSKKMSGLKVWLGSREHPLGIPHEKILVILDEISSNEIGLKGCNFFTVSYSFFGSVLSLILTYAIIILQFQTQETTAVDDIEGICRKKLQQLNNGGFNNKTI